MSNDRWTKSHPSRTSKSDTDPFAIHDHRDQALAPADLEHLIQVILILNDIPVVHRTPVFFKGLTGLDGIGSTGFTVDDYNAHNSPPEVRIQNPESRT